MRKSHPFDVLSDRVCVVPGCDKHLKLRLVEEKPTVIKCFGCFRDYEAGRDHPMSTAREIRTGVRPARLKKLIIEGGK